jgi:lysophospholipase L1-like esterase
VRGIDPRSWAPGDARIQADGHPLADGGVFLPALDDGDGRPHIVMVGDSVLLTLTRPFDPGPPSRADYYSYASPGCSVLPGTDDDHGRVGSHQASCTLLEKRWRMLVSRRRPDLSFLLFGAFEVVDRLVDGHVYRVGTAEWTRLFRDALTRDVDLFASRGGLVALPTVPCFDPPNYGVAGVAGGQTDRRDPKRVAAVNAVIREVARQRPKVVRIVDLGGFLCPGGHARDRIDGVRLRIDGVHFTHGGARIVASWLAPHLEALIPPGPVFATNPTR